MFDRIKAVAATMGEPGYQAALFDMDGVLIDTEASVIRFWNDLADEHGVSISAADFIAHVYGRTPNDTMTALFPKIDPDGRRAVHDRIRVYEGALEYVSIPGAPELLRGLKRAGIPAVLVTSGSIDKVRRVVEQLALDGLLAAFVTHEDISRGKPDPEPYLTGAGKAGVPGARCIAFEDAVGGVTSAVAAGARCIGIGNAITGPALLAAGATVVVPDLTAVRVEIGEHGAVLLAGDDLRLTLSVLGTSDAPAI